MIRHCGTVMRSEIVAFLSPIQRYHFTFDETNGHVHAWIHTQNTGGFWCDRNRLWTSNIASYTVKMMNRILILRFLFFVAWKIFNDELVRMNVSLIGVFSWALNVCAVDIMKIKWNRTENRSKSPRRYDNERTAHKKRANFYRMPKCQ